MARYGPSKFYYVLMLAGLAASFFSFRLLIERRFETITASLERGSVPGVFSLELRKKGHHAVYVEYRGSLGNRLFLTAQELGALECTLTSAAGEALSLSRPLLAYGYDGEAHAGVAVLEFQVPRPGTYRLQGRYPEGTPGPDLLLAVGEGPLGDLSLPILGGFALALAPGLIGVGVGIAIWRIRKQARRRLYGRHA